MEIVENYLGIKNHIKTKYGLDIVITQSGKYFEALEEDADSIEREFAWNKHQRVQTLDTMFAPLLHPVKWRTF